MEWLNYHHLLYFWTVAKEGSIARACDKLRWAQLTISGQLRLLEETLGEKLFVKQGRGLAMTEVGQVVYRYAEEIFGLGRELQDVLKNRPRGRPLRLLAGGSDLIPKLIAYRVQRPALEMPEPVQIICDEGPPEHLLAELAEHRMDVVLSDAPIPPTVPVKAYNHLLGTSTASIFAAPQMAARYRKNFPACLDGAPFSLADARIQFEASAGTVVRIGGHPSCRHRRIQGQGADDHVRSGGRRRFCRPHGHREGNPRAIPGRFDWPNRFHCRAFLRHLRREKTEASRGRHDLRCSNGKALCESLRPTLTKSAPIGLFDELIPKHLLDKSAHAL